MRSADAPSITGESPLRPILGPNSVLTLIGEPHISAWTPDEMRDDLRAAGFTVTNDTGIADWNAAFADGQASVERAAYMRVVVATR